MNGWMNEIHKWANYKRKKTALCLCFYEYVRKSIVVVNDSMTCTAIYLMINTAFAIKGLTYPYLNIAVKLETYTNAVA